MGYAFDHNRNPYPNGWGGLSTKLDSSSVDNSRVLARDRAITDSLGLKPKIGYATEKTSDVLSQMRGWMRGNPILDVVPAQKNNLVVVFSNPETAQMVKQQMPSGSMYGAVIGNTLVDVAPNEVGKAVSKAATIQLYSDHMRRGDIGRKANKVMNHNGYHQREQAGAAVIYEGFGGEIGAATGMLEDGRYILITGPQLESTVAKFAKVYKVSPTAMLQYLLTHENIHTYANAKSKGVSESTLEGIVEQVASELAAKSPFPEQQRMYKEMKKTARKRGGQVKKNYASAQRKAPTYPSGSHGGDHGQDGGHGETHGEHGHGDQGHAPSGGHAPSHGQHYQSPLYKYLQGGQPSNYQGRTNQIAAAKAKKAAAKKAARKAA